MIYGKISTCARSTWRGRRGIDQKTLSNYETGKTNPDSEAILRLADFFRVSTNYLLGSKTAPDNI